MTITKYSDAYPNHPYAPTRKVLMEYERFKRLAGEPGIRQKYFRYLKPNKDGYYDHILLFYNPVISGYYLSWYYQIPLNQIYLEDTLVFPASKLLNP